MVSVGLYHYSFSNICTANTQEAVCKGLIVVATCITVVFVLLTFTTRPFSVQQDVFLKKSKPIVTNENVISITTLRWLTAQIQVECSNWQFFRPQWMDKDGGWAVCMARPFLPQKPCIIYSFGSKYDWTFADAYQEMFGCKIRNFYPSTGKKPEHAHKPGMLFYPMGLSDRKELDPRGRNMDSFKGFLTRFGDQDRIISYLKFDGELSDWKVLDNMLSDGVLENVMQLAFKLHIPQNGNTTEYVRILKGLESQGFRRWYGHHHFVYFSTFFKFRFQSDQVYINTNFLPSGDEKYLKAAGQ